VKKLTVIQKIWAKREKVAKLTTSEKKLLSILDKDSWLTLREMGRLLNISASTINYRISKLIRLGVLQRLSINVNLEKIGYNVAFVGINNIINEDASQAAEHISKDNNVLCVHRGIGHYSLLTKVCYKDFNELSDMLEKWKNDLGDVLMEVFLVTDIYKSSAFPDFFPELDYKVYRQAYTKVSEKDQDKASRETKVDEKDLKILTILDKDNWTRFKEIGEYVKLSANSVFFRIRKMILNQIIKNFTIVIDPQKAGFTEVYLFIDTLRSQLNSFELASKLASDPNVVFVATGIGEYSVLTRVLVEGPLRKLHRKVEELIKRKYTNISIKYFIALDTCKNLAFPDFFPEFTPRPPINCGKRYST